VSVLSLDIETTGLSPWKDSITCVGLWEPGKQEVLRGNYQKLADINQELVGQNFKFDLKFLKVHHNWLPLHLYQWDTQIMAHICTDKIPDSWLEVYEFRRRKANQKLPQGVSHRQAGRYSLKTLAPYFLGVEPFWETPDNHDNDEYVLKDCEYTYRLYKVLKKKLEEQGSLDFYKRVLQWNKMLLRMELTGIELDFESLDKAEEEYKEIRSVLESEIKDQWADQFSSYFNRQAEEVIAEYDQKLKAAIARLKDKSKTESTIQRYKKLQDKKLAKLEEFNLSSSSQMAWLLGEQLGYDITDDEGKPSTKKSVLNRLNKEGKQDVAKYLEWRDADKVLTMYLPTYHSLHDSGVIHPSFNIAGTRTGRLSCREPNLQAVPPKLYKLFKPREGKKFVQYDLSGIEAALIALYSGDKNLYKILKDGHSIHDYNTITFFGLDCEPGEVKEKYPNMRKTSKEIGFSLFYGAGFKRIKESFLKNGYEIDDTEAKKKLKDFKKFYKSAVDFHKYITEVFESGGTVENLFGRPIKIQEWESAYMNGFNTLVQSSASDLNIRACEKAESAWRDSRLDCRPLLLIHDCILAEAASEDAEEADKILKKCMTGFTLKSENGIINLEVEGGVSEKWEK